jgi:hypothetical protein
MPDLQNIPWDQITGLLNALAALAWPIFAAFLVLVFMREIKRILRRLEGGEGWGFKFKLRRDLNRLVAVTESLPRRRLRSFRTLGRGPTVLAFEHGAGRWPGSSETDPKTRLIELDGQIEDALRLALEASGESADSGDGSPWSALLTRLRDRRVLPSVVLDAAAQFHDVRNQIVHGGGAGPDEVISALDVGERILEALPRPQLPKHPPDEIQQ